MLSEVGHNISLLLRGLELDLLVDGVLGPAHEPLASVGEDQALDHPVDGEAESEEYHAACELVRGHGGGSVSVEHEDEGGSDHGEEDVGEHVREYLVDEEGLVEQARAEAGFDHGVSLLPEGVHGTLVGLGAEKGGLHAEGDRFEGAPFLAVGKGGRGRVLSG